MTECLEMAPIAFKPKHRSLVAYSTRDQFEFDFELCSASSLHALMANPKGYFTKSVKKAYPLAKFVVLVLYKEPTVLYYEGYGYQNGYSTDLSKATIYVREAGGTYEKYRGRFPGSSITGDPKLVQTCGLDYGTNHLYPDVPSLLPYVESRKSPEEQVTFAIHMARDYPEESKYYLDLLEQDLDDVYAEPYWIQVLRGQEL